MQLDGVSHHVATPHLLLHTTPGQESKQASVRPESNDRIQTSLLGRLLSEASQALAQRTQPRPHMVAWALEVRDNPLSLPDAVVDALYARAMHPEASLGSERF